jgi:uncharacterized peroxidase-related enzyme
VEHLKADWSKSDINAADRAMLSYAVKLTLEPWHMERADIDTLRRVGFTDADILDINQVTSYYAYVNRLADGLGVELEAFWDET